MDSALSPAYTRSPMVAAMNSLLGRCLDPPETFLFILSSSLLPICSGTQLAERETGQIMQESKIGAKLLLPLLMLLLRRRRKMVFNNNS